MRRFGSLSSSEPTVVSFSFPVGSSRLLGGSISLGSEGEEVAVMGGNVSVGEV
jgi:hypothetical protein